MRVFAASFATETNTFCSIPTTKKSFHDEYYRYREVHDIPPHVWALPLTIFKTRCEERNWEYIESLCTGAQPAGPIVKQDYEELRDLILNDLALAMPLDLVLLNLHGAMVAEEYEDCEGDILRRARAIVGPNTPVGVLLDPHANLTENMYQHASAILCYKEYPHTDIAESAEQLFALMADSVLGKTKLCMAYYDCRVINSYPTTIEPMRSYMEVLRAKEREENVLAISVVHGFPWGDVPDMGTKIIVITDNQPEKAKSLAQVLGTELFALRGKTLPTFYSIDDALALAEKSSAQPAVLADFSDNTGGGAPGDSTFILRSLIEKNISNAALGVIWDPVAVEIAFSAGIGSKLPLRIGGKLGPQSGMPIDLMVEVAAIDPDLTINFAQSTAHYGKSVLIKSNGIDIVLSSLRLQVYSTECFSKMGVDLSQKSIIVVKSSAHFRTSFEKVSKTIIMVSAPGALCPDFGSIPYKKVNRPIWPLDSVLEESTC